MQDTGCSGLVHWDDPEGWYGEGGGRGGSGWGTCVHPWWIHVDVWQNQYNIVKLKKKKRINLLMQEMWEKSSFDPRVRKVP